MTLDVVILAAGQGSRMHSKLPKVLHEIAGKSMLRHVVEVAAKIGADNTHIVIGHGADLVKEAIPNYPVMWSLQAEQKGTGHAVAQALPKGSPDTIPGIFFGYKLLPGGLWDNEYRVVDSRAFKDMGFLGWGGNENVHVQTVREVVWLSACVDSPLFVKYALAN